MGSKLRKYLSIDCHRHIIRIDVQSHRIAEIVELTQTQNYRKPPYDPEATCPYWDSILEEAFYLSSNPEEMKRHLYEVIASLLIPSHVVKPHWVLIGDMAEPIMAVIDKICHKAHKRVKVVKSQTPFNRPPENTRVIPFTGSLDALSPYDFDFALEETAGILNHVLKATLGFMERGFRFDTPDDCKEAEIKYAAEWDSIGAFIRTACIVDESIFSTRNELYDRYSKWCGTSSRPIGIRDFLREFESRGFQYISQKITGIAPICYM